MIRIAICDDEEAHLRYTERLAARELAQYTPEISLFPGAEPLLEAVEEAGYAPDIAILDIRMADTDGIALARALNRALPACRVIFLTGYLSYATEVYETEHVYYILKAEMDARMGTALRRALAPPQPVHYVLRYRDHAVVNAVPAEEVRFLERRLRKTRIAAGREAWTTQTPQELLAGLPGELFIRCHQSYWVRAGAIRAMEPDAFVLAGGERIPISRSYRKQARARFFHTLEP